MCMRHSFAGRKVAGATDNLCSSSKTWVETLKLGFSLNKMTFHPDIWRKEVLGTAPQVYSEAFQV